jgi:hypothetical protein
VCHCTGKPLIELVLEYTTVRLIHKVTPNLHEAILSHRGEQELANSVQLDDLIDLSGLLARGEVEDPSDHLEDIGSARCLYKSHAADHSK